ncbi:hypothetical protein [Azonexus fungiphilus]|nr:hypothetical protein [Azonexus fungiphilus]
MIMQLFGLLVVAQLNIFPAFNLFRLGADSYRLFAHYQSLYILLFEVPFFAVMRFFSRNEDSVKCNAPLLRISILSPFLPVILLALLAVFWTVALEYGLLFRRLGHEELQAVQAGVPTLLLYFYRLAVESAVFVVLFLGIVLRYSPKDASHISLYRVTFLIYISSFMAFFLLNSRMQLIVFALAAICVFGKAWGRNNPARYMFLGMVLFFAAMMHTIWREVVVESNGRVLVNSIWDALSASLKLMLDRIDTMNVIYRIGDRGLDPWEPHFSSIRDLFSFYWSFFFNQQAYLAIKGSLLTSPSVQIANLYLPDLLVDFPKTMAMDVLLIFGASGLPVFGVVLGVVCVSVQRGVARSQMADGAFITALYILPLLFQFEKEFSGFFFATIKWLPILLVVYYFRPGKEIHSVESVKC